MNRYLEKQSFVLAHVKFEVPSRHSSQVEMLSGRPKLRGSHRCRDLIVINLKVRKVEIYCHRCGVINSFSKMGLEEFPWGDIVGKVKTEKRVGDNPSTLKGTARGHGRETSTAGETQNDALQSPSLPFKMEKKIPSLITTPGEL